MLIYNGIIHLADLTPIRDINTDFELFTQSDTFFEVSI